MSFVKIHVGLSTPIRHFQQRFLPIRTFSMSLRRSARVQVQSKSEEDELPNGKVATKEASATKKRGRKSKADGTDTSTTEAIASTAIAQDAMEDTEHMPPPTTPNKRRKIDSNSKVPPITPTPSAIGFMTSTSSTTKPTPQPPATRPVKPNHTNAPLLTPGGTQTYSTFEDNSSPSKSAAAPPSTNKTLLSTACAHLLSVDPSLGPVIEKHHCKVFSPSGLAEEIDPFRALASGIIAQQVSGAAAKSIKNKFVSLFSSSPEDCANGFPTPKAVVEKPMAELRSAGLSQRKAEYIQGLAGKFEAGEITVKGLLEGEDEDVMRELVAVRGLGRWSVEMFMCFGLKRTDVFSTGDLGVQRGMAAHAGKDVSKLKNKGGKWKYMSEKDMLEISAKFSPYRSLFMWYMWRVEDVDVSAVQDN